MRVETRFPDHGASLGIQRIDIGANVPEVHEKPIAPASRADGRCRADAGVGAKRPVDAAACGVERVDEPGVRADKYASANNRWLTVRGVAMREAEGPFQRELRHVV